MLLEFRDLELFFRLHRTLMFFVNQRLEVIPDHLATPEEFAALSPNVRVKVRNALLEHTDLIEAFVEENPAHLGNEELDIVRSWRHFVAGKFYLYRELTKYTVFLSTSDPVIAYGVLALSQPFEDLVGPNLPILTEMVLLPFRGMLIYDGLLNAYSVSFGPGIRRSLNDSFKEAKARLGIVTSLPMSATPTVPTKTPKVKPRPTTNPKVQTDRALATILGLIEPFCKKHLNDEYADLCRRLAEKLARKRPSPLLSGSPNTWASGIVRTIGWVNFLHDKSQTPYMRMTDIDAGFGVSESSGTAKLATIRKLMKLHQLDPNWSLASRLDDNPMVWIFEVNGLMMDIRHAPREIQEIAFAKKLIPYIPADRK